MTETGWQFYNRIVNSKWPDEYGRPTDAEAITAARRLYRRGMGRVWRGPVKIVRGNRVTWVNWVADKGQTRRRDTLCVNPDMRGGGWKEIVHSMSHYCHRRLNPKDRPHSQRQASLEADFTDYLLKSGWLDGKLKRPSKPKPPRDIVAERAARIEKRIAAWTAKQKRATNALKTLRVKRRYYERKLQQRDN